MRFSDALASLWRRDEPSQALLPGPLEPGPVRKHPVIDVEAVSVRCEDDSKPAPARTTRLLRLPASELAVLHAEALRDWMSDPEEFTPGEVLSVAEMTEIYADLCQRKGWRQRPWNPVAAHLNKLLGKTYRRTVDPDGTERRVRGYIVPKAKRQSKRRQERLQRDAAPVMVGPMRRAA